MLQVKVVVNVTMICCFYTCAYCHESYHAMYIALCGYRYCIYIIYVLYIIYKIVFANFVVFVNTYFVIVQNEYIALM